jgi:Recombination endonuclease VII
MKLKASELAGWREQRLAANSGRCGLCQLPVRRPVADHDHSTGQLRDVICGGCNSVLGKVENNYQRYGVQNLSAFLNGAAKYLMKHLTPQHNVMYPTHLTEDEKRLKRNTKARKARAATKKADA